MPLWEEHIIHSGLVLSKEKIGDKTYNEVFQMLQDLERIGRIVSTPNLSEKVVEHANKESKKIGSLATQAAIVFHQ